MPQKAQQAGKALCITLGLICCDSEGFILKLIISYVKDIWQHDIELSDEQSCHLVSCRLYIWQHCLMHC